MSIHQVVKHPKDIRILLVEEDEADYEALVELLDLSGNGPFHIDWRRNREQASNALLDRHYDVVMLGETMDNAGELGLLRLARTLRPNLPVIVLSDRTEEASDGLEAIRQGAAEYLEKQSLTSSYLSRVIRYAIERQRSQEHIREMERYSALGQAATAISHNMKNILTRMRGGLTLLDKRHRTHMNTEMETIFGILNRSSIELQRLTEKVLNFVQPHQCEFELACPNQLISDVFEICRHDAMVRGIELSRNYAVNPPMIRCDRHALKDMVLNLVSNSMDACHGIVNARIEMESRVVDGQCIQLRICDNGHGIPAEIQTHIFEPFFTTKGCKGHGLGLATVKKLADAQSARLSVYSEPGRTEFSLEFEDCPQAGEMAARGA